MPPKGQAGILPDLTPDRILDLGERLALISIFSTQKRTFEEFLQDHFGGNATIWLTSPHKSLETDFVNVTFPFDPNIGLAQEENTHSINQTFKIDDQHWGLIQLRFGQQEFGKIILQRDHPFTFQELDTLTEVSKVASLSIFATLQIDLHRWRQKKLNLVKTVTARISQITELEVLTQEISKLIQQTFNYYYVAIFLIQESSGRLLFEASEGSDESERPDFERSTHPGFELGEHMIGHVAETGIELVANDVTREQRYQAVDSLEATESEAVIPLNIENRTLGVLDIQSNRKNAFEDDDLLVLRALADNIAIAIEGVRLYQSVQRRADQLATISEVSRAISSILDIDELLQQIVEIIHERFKFPFVHLYTIDSVHQIISFKAGSGSRSPVFDEAGIAYDIHSDKGILPWVVQHGKTKRVNDVQKEPLFQKAPQINTNKGSEMAVPIEFGGEILGVLDILSDETNAFFEEDQQLMETLADNLSIAIRNARLYRSEKWRRQVAESLRDVAGFLSENIALNDVLNAILEELRKNLPCDIAGIWLFDSIQSPPSDQALPRLHLAAHQTSDRYHPDDLNSLSHTPDDWIKSVLLQKEPKIRQSDEKIGPIAKRYGFNPDYSAIAAPLSTGDDILGMLTLVHHTPGRYGSESQKITSAFASYAAIAIKNTRLYATSQEQAWISTILLQVANAIQSSTNLDEFMATIVRLTPMVVGIKGCSLLIKEPDSNVFVLSAMYGMGDPGEEKRLTKPLPLINAPILDELLILQEPLRVRHPVEDLNLPEDFRHLMSGDELVLLPLMARTEVLGAFLLANEADPNEQEIYSAILSEERFKIIQGIVQQTAMAIENIRLIEARQEEAYMSAVLLQAAQATVSSANLEDTLDSMVNIMPILVGIDASVIYLWDDGEQSFKTNHARTKSMADDELLGTRYFPGDFSMLDVVFRNNRPMVYPFIETALPPEDWDLALPDEGQTDPTPVLQSRYPLLMGFPLSVKDDVYGVLLALDENYATNREKRFELLWGIAQQASLAIQNDLLNKEMLDRQRLEREFQLAREIQQTFLPTHRLDIPGWEMGVHWETARQVGGDFYDYFLLPDGRLAFVIADVSDKGLAASLYMAVTRTLLRAAALEANSPSATLENVNELLLNNSQNGLFVTTFYGILSLKDGRLCYTNGGHNPPLIIRHQQKNVVTLQKGGIALGAMPDIHLPEHQTTLNPGDCLVLYTDGVTEAFNDQDQMYGDERLLQILKMTIGKNASEVLKTIEADLADFRDGAPLSDDTTMLAICRSILLGDNDGDVRTA